MRAVILVSLLASAAVGTQLSGGNIKRQGGDCSSVGLKACGDGCVPLSYTCCPDQKEGCPANTVCSLGDNNEYGCCPIGRVCQGPGGAITSTITGPGETTSITDISTVTGTTITDISTPAAPTYTTTPTYSPPPHGTGSPTYYTNTTTTSYPTSVVTAGANAVYGAGSAAGMLGALVAGLLI